MKPIAWYDPSNGMVSTDQDCPLFTPLGQVWGLYPKQEWVELTDDEIEMIYAVTIKIRKKDIMPGEQKMFAKTIQHFLKERNT
jgi:hypothetical protein